MAPQPQRKIGLNFLDELLRRGSKQFSLGPYGNYSGSLVATLTQANPIITNPWGVAAREGETYEGGDRPPLYLEAGQSFNAVTGQYSDPKLHANTAKRLNDALQQRLAGAAGLGQAQKDSARAAPSVLAALDEMYFANQKTEVTTSYQLSNLAQANAQGLNTSGAKTILGIQKPDIKVTAKPAVKRALT